MNGDKITDLLVRTDDDKLVVYPSTGNLSFEDKPSDEVTVPDDGMVSFEDINGDGLIDMIVASGPQQQVTVFLSTPK